MKVKQIELKLTNEDCGVLIASLDFLNDQLTKEYISNTANLQVLFINEETNTYLRTWTKTIHSNIQYKFIRDDNFLMLYMNITDALNFYSKLMK